MSPAGAPATTPLTRGRMTGRVPVARVRTAPGVSVEWVGPVFRGIEALRGDVAGFVGLAPRGPTDHAVRLASASEFDTVYGPPVDGMLLAPAVHGFFANGGATCWVVRAVDRHRASVAEVAVDGTVPGIVFRARSEGSWANGTTVDVQPTGGARVTVTVTAPDRRQEVWRDLDALGLRSHFGDRNRSDASASALVSLTLPPGAHLSTTVAPLVLTGGDDGLADLVPAHLTGEGTGSAEPLLPHGAAQLVDVEEVSQVVVPDLVIRDPRSGLGLRYFTPTALESTVAFLVGECEALHRIALLQHPDPDALADEVVAWRQRNVRSAYAAMYWPWLRTPDPRRAGRLLAVPPGGHVAGIIARGDLGSGPHKPPANEQVVGAVGLTRPVDDDDHGRVNHGGVNAIRAVAGRGIRVLGARTTSDEAEWSYLNVRRLVTQVERSVSAYAGWLVFEPDDQSLRDDVDRVVRQLLDELWRSGWLEGATTDEAYSVHIEAAQTAADARLVVDVGLQPPWPAEFVSIRIDVPDLGHADRTRGGGDGGDHG